MIFILVYFGIFAFDNKLSNQTGIPPWQIKIIICDVCLLFWFAWYDRDEHCNECDCDRGGIFSERFRLFLSFNGEFAIFPIGILFQVKRRVRERDFRTYLWGRNTVSKGIISKLIDKVIYFFHDLFVNKKFEFTLFCQVLQVFFPACAWTEQLFDILARLASRQNGSNIHLERNIYLTTQNLNYNASFTILFNQTPSVHIIINTRISHFLFYSHLTLQITPTHQFFMTNNMTTDRLNLDKLVESESNYEANITDTLNIIQKDKNLENALKKVILFCKYLLGAPGVQKKKFLCLHVTPFPFLSLSKTWAKISKFNSLKRPLMNTSPPKSWKPSLLKSSKNKSQKAKASVKFNLILGHFFVYFFRRWRRVFEQTRRLRSRNCLLLDTETDSLLNKVQFQRNFRRNQKTQTSHPQNIWLLQNGKNSNRNLRLKRRP